MREGDAMIMDYGGVALSALLVLAALYVLWDAARRP
jgi:hypothetical protein